MNSLDKNILIKQPIQRNQYVNLLVMLSTITSLMCFTIIAFTEDEASEMSYFYSFAVMFIVLASETLLLTELATHLTRKFSVLNSNLYPHMTMEKQQTKHLIMSNFEEKNAELIAEKIIKIMETHHHLSAISRKLNDIFNFPILVTTALNFEFATINLYYAWKLTTLPPTFNSIAQSIMSVMWSAVVLMETFITTKGFENIAEKVSTGIREK